MTSIDMFSSATQMLHALRARDISAVELLDLHIARIEQHDPAINAVVTRDFERARRSAIEADAARARGADAPLLGLPMTVKDCIHLAGLPTTGGVVERRDAISEQDAPAVARLRAAGAVFMGKTNVPPYAGDIQAWNPLFGRTNNPWDLERTPGGSSGGSAAALAAGMTPLELGGDLAGSIRQPAAFCGVYGLRPSETAVPRTGHFPGGLLPNAAVWMVVQGPMARSAEDLELALDVIAGPDVGEDVAWRIELPPARHGQLNDYRVAVLPQPDWLIMDDEILAAQDSLAEQLRAAGVRVETVTPDAFGDLRDYFKTFLHIFWSMVRPHDPDESRALAVAFRAADEFGVAAAEGIELSAPAYVAAFGQRERYRAALRAFFRDWDVLISPANVVNAFPHIHFDVPFAERRLLVNGIELPYEEPQIVYPALCNLSGQPGVAFPTGRTQTGLPIGLQAIGPYLEDRTTIRFAQLVAEVTGDR